MSKLGLTIRRLQLKVTYLLNSSGRWPSSTAAWASYMLTGLVDAVNRWHVFDYVTVIVCSYVRSGPARFTVAVNASNDIIGLFVDPRVLTYLMVLWLYELGGITITRNCVLQLHKMWLRSDVP